MNSEHYQRLVQGYTDKTLTEEELLVFTHLLQEGVLDEALKAAMDNEAGITAMDEVAFGKTGRLVPIWLRYAAAAVAFVLVAGITYFLVPRNTKPVAPLSQRQPDIAPGKNKAILTLQGNQQIVLDDADSGLLAYQGNTALVKTKTGQLRYDAAGGATPGALNTLTTPMGGQYQLVLPDGSKVWLNAASSITFPAAFAGKERVVQITGEVYFEVHQQPNQPFIVKTVKQQVRVLGTHFNINSYEDEQSEKTTLLEGAVQVSANASAKPVQLAPGQQAVVANGTSTTVVSADTEGVIDWKEGYFIFNDEDLESIMRKVARWYNVKIEYQFTPDHLYFGGMVSRDKNVSAVLKIMESTGSVHFRIKENKIIVMP